MSDAATAQRAIKLLDLTSLNDDDTDADIEALCDRATGAFGHVAAVCVWPHFVSLCAERLAGSPVRIVAAANFPDGEADTVWAADEAAAAIEDGAHEVDVVLPYGAWLAGDRATAMELVEDCKAAVGPDRTLKVILETGALGTPLNIRGASMDAIAAGADFIKTSTGKTEISATPGAAETMLRVIADAERPVGFKASGGIRTTEDAAQYLALADEIMGPGWAMPATFRIGASGLLGDLLKTLGLEDADGPGGAY